MYGGISASMLMELASMNGKFYQLDLPLELPPEYTLPMEYFTDVQTGFEVLPPNCNTKYKTTQSEDHPGFARLRKILSGGNYIKMELGWSNGDRVLKRFCVNGKWFEPGDKFPCACALGDSLVQNTGE